MSNTKTSSGFDLIIGHLLNEGWERAKVPFSRDFQTCAKCKSSDLDVWELERRLNAFGQIIVQHCTAIACRNCLHELLIEAHQKSKAKKGKSKSPSLSKAQSVQLSKFLLGLSPEQLKEFLK